LSAGPEAEAEEAPVEVAPPRRRGGRPKKVVVAPRTIPAKVEVEEAPAEEEAPAPAPAPARNPSFYDTIEACEAADAQIGRWGGTIDTVRKFKEMEAELEVLRAFKKKIDDQKKREREREKARNEAKKAGRPPAQKKATMTEADIRRIAREEFIKSRAKPPAPAPAPAPEPESEAEESEVEESETE